MTIAKQHQEFKLRFNKIDSNHYQDLKPWQIDSFLNQASLFIVENYGELNNHEFTQVNKDVLGSLVIKYPEQPEVVPFAVKDNQYEYRLDTLKYEYHHLVRVYIYCNRLIIPVSLIKHDDQLKLNDSYQKPSFKWKRLPAVIGKSSTVEGKSLYVYSDVDLEKKKLRIEYIKFPKQVYFGGYDSIEFIDCEKNNGADCGQFYNTGDLPVNSDLPESYHDLQVDIAVMLAANKIENINLLNLVQNKLVNLPK